jgi:hypothetical protein
LHCHYFGTDSNTALQRIEFLLTKLSTGFFGFKKRLIEQAIKAISEESLEGTQLTSIPL